MWAGEPNGRAENPKRCIVECYSNDRTMTFYQCFNKRNGPDKLCGTHRRIKKAGKKLSIPKDEKGRQR